MGNSPRRLFARMVAPVPYLYRSAGTKQKSCPRRTLGAELRSSRPVSAPRQKKSDDNKHNQIIFCAEQGARADVHSSACLRGRILVPAAQRRALPHTIKTSIIELAKYIKTYII
jgi:hypothetical protein